MPVANGPFVAIADIGGYVVFNRRERYMIDQLYMTRQLAQRRADKENAVWRKEMAERRAFAPSLN
jgi:hypothetical protein